MKNIKGKGLVLSIILLLGCKQPERTIGLFVNLSRAFDFQKIHLLARSGDNIVLDTVIENNHIDKSVLLKRFDADLIINNMLSIEIGSKFKNIKIPNNNQSCIDVFTFYDDHTMINNKASEIENRKINRGLMADYKQIVDSLKKSSKIDFYDKIEVNIKPRSCKD